MHYLALLVIFAGTVYYGFKASMLIAHPAGLYLIMMAMGALLILSELLLLIYFELNEISRKVSARSPDKRKDED